MNNTLEKINNILSQVPYITFTYAFTLHMIFWKMQQAKDCCSENAIIGTILVISFGFLMFLIEQRCCEQ